MPRRIALLRAINVGGRKGVAASKLTPAAIDKAAGSPATGRNHNTVVKLGELAR